MAVMSEQREGYEKMSSEGKQGQMGHVDSLCTLAFTLKKLAAVGEFSAD